MVEDLTPRQPDGSLGQMLARIDERTLQLVRDINEMKTNAVTRAELESKIQPIRLVTFGLVGTILLGFVGALLTLVLK